MAKIKKGLTDEEMLKGFSEQLTFENGIYEEKTFSAGPGRAVKAPATNELLLPEEARERLNRFLLEISMEWLKNKNGSCTWKVLRENGQIIIKPAALAKK